MFLIYRVEHSEVNHHSDDRIGVGPYNFRDSDEDCQWVDFYSELSDMGNKHGFETHPSKWDDFRHVTKCDSTYFLACPSHDSLKEWFSGHMSMLNRAGFNVIEYKVKSFVGGRSGKQCAFMVNDILEKKVLRKGKEY